MNNHLTDNQLDMLLEGEANDMLPFKGQAALASHLKDCTTCRQRLTEIVSQEQVMFRYLHRVTCPTPLMLFEHVTNVTPRSEIAQYLEKEESLLCHQEIAMLAEWEQFPLSIAPYRAKPFFSLRRIIAKLIPQKQLTPVLRGQISPISLYDAGDLILSFDCLPSMTQAGRKALHGMLLPLDNDVAGYEGFMVRLSQDGRVVGESDLSAYGGFVFEELTKGNYRVVLSLPNEHVIIENLEVH
jgi:hypothetical protein